MNQRFLNIHYKQEHNINIDRQHFNINTRDDKTMNKHKINKNNNIASDMINIDRQFFNINSDNNKFKSQNIADRNFHDYLTQNNLRNRNTNIHDNRINNATNSSNRKIIKEKTPMDRRMFLDTMNNPIRETTIETIDTKNNDYKQFKKVNKNKFNPFAIY